MTELLTALQSKIPGQPKMLANEQFGFPTVLLATISSSQKANNNSLLGSLVPSPVSQTAVEVDATIQERHTFENKITLNPLEMGEPITDNVINLPVKLEMKGRVSTTPISLINALVTTGAGIGVSLLSPTTSPIIKGGASLVAGILSSKSSSKRHITAYDLLVKFRNDKTLLTIITGLHVYPNMVIEMLIFPREKGDGRSMVFQATFMQPLFVGNSSGLDSNNIKGPNNGVGVNLGPQMANPIS